MKLDIGVIGILLLGFLLAVALHWKELYYPPPDFTRCPLCNTQQKIDNGSSSTRNQDTIQKD